MRFIRRAGVTAKRPAAQVNVLADRWLAGGLPTATADCTQKIQDLVTRAGVTAKRPAAQLNVQADRDAGHNTMLSLSLD